MPITLNGDTGIQTPMYNGTITANAVTPSVNMKNRIINGAMTIDQRALGTTTINSGSSWVYTLDRWSAIGESALGVYTLQQSTAAPAGFTNSFLATVTTSSSITSGNIYVLRQIIEGFNTADLGFGTASASTVTLSFWVRSSLTGTFGGVIKNGANNRSYPFTYTINAANTWEYETITIAGDTTGTWATDNTAGLQVFFSLGTGSAFLGTAGTWAGSDLYGATGQTNIIPTSGATFQVTGVQLEKGSNATSFDYRPYGTELNLCYRYYYKVKSAGTSYSNLATGYNTSTTTANVMVFFPVTLRTRPTSLETSGTVGDYAIAHTNTATTCSAVPTYSAPSNEFQSLTTFTVSSGLTAGQGSRGCSELNNANAFLAWSAEL